MLIEFQCLESLQSSTLPEAVELANLLTRNEFEGLLYAHDTIARDSVTERVPLPVPDSESMVPNHTPVHTDEDEESNIKIIKIEKTNEPLVCFIN